VGGAGDLIEVEDVEICPECHSVSVKEVGE
jgi:hypothetical protein